MRTCMDVPRARPKVQRHAQDLAIEGAGLDSIMASDDYPYHVLNGLQVPLFVSQEMLDELKTFELYPDDIWIATYPKCGTTWTQQIVKLIRNRGEKDDVKISASVPWPEAIKRYQGVIHLSIISIESVHVHWNLR